jgi:hypothetical protein
MIIIIHNIQASPEIKLYPAIPGLFGSPSLTEKRAVVDTLALNTPQFFTARPEAMLGAPLRHLVADGNP